ILSPDWITTEFNNQNSPASFFSVISGLTNSSSAPVVAFSPTGLTFASQNTNTTSPIQTVTLTNNGPGSLTITSINLTGANPSDFSLSSNCLSGSIAANSSCSLNLSFTPSATGPGSASVSISDNGAASPQSFSLSGTGVSPLPSSWPNGYSYQATFTVASGKVPSPLSNFPALISGSFPDFRTTSNGGRIANTCTQLVGNNSLSVPCDLIFTSDPNGSSPLSWEFESYNPSTGTVNIWLRFPSISSGSVAYAWYGN